MVRNKISNKYMGCFFFLRYGASILKQTKSELDEIDRKTRKLMAMNKGLQARSDVNRLYVSRMEGGKGLTRCKMCVKAEENSLGWYVKHHTESLIVAVRKSNTVPIENSTQPKELSNKIMRED